MESRGFFSVPELASAHTQETINYTSKTLENLCSAADIFNARKKDQTKQPTRTTHKHGDGLIRFA